MPSHLAATQPRNGRLAPCPVALECMSPRRASREPRSQILRYRPASGLLLEAATRRSCWAFRGVHSLARAFRGVHSLASVGHIADRRCPALGAASPRRLGKLRTHPPHKVFNLCHQSIPHSVQGWSHQQLEKSASSQLCGPNDCPARSLVRSSFPLRLNSHRSLRSTVCKHELTRTAGARRLISLSVNSRRIGRGYTCSGLACTRFWHTQRMIPPLFAFAVVRFVRHV